MSIKSLLALHAETRCLDSTMLWSSIFLPRDPQIAFDCYKWIDQFGSGDLALFGEAVEHPPDCW